MAKRYDQLIKIVRERQPRTIVEIGVHRGIRARKMCEAVDGPVHYIGYDVFETMGEAFQEAALNGKGEPTEAAARARLDELKRHKHDFTYEFIVGDTRETLHGKEVEADLVFIDGDHRIEAIIGDFLAVADSKVIALDDWYKPGKNGALPDLQKFGANIIGSLHDGHIEVLPHGDECKHGGVSHIAVVYND
jgi:predicted O-methyltransferase YrrM